MPDDLPTRPFTALPPPPAGATAAVRQGRVIRRRRQLAGAGAAAASMAVVAGVLVAVGGSTPHAADELVPAGPTRPTVSTETQPGSDESATGSLTLASPRPSPSAAARPSPTSTRATAAGPSQATSARSPAPSRGYRTPNLIRRYHAAPPQTGGPSGRICGGGSEAGGNGSISNGYGFCVDGYAVSTSRGHDLILEVCRDSTGPGSLRFPRELEAELVVHDVLDKDRVVWRWSTGHANDDDVHVLKLETSACWTWTAPWTDVDARGRRLEPSDYAVAVKSAADQLRGMPEQRASFRIR